MLPLPNVDGVRLANLEDLPRISIVAAAAFFWSPSFRFQRPCYKEFPEDTIASYWNEYEAAIQDPTCVVLVTEDILEADEAEHIYEALRSACPPSMPGQQGIVGVCSINLKPESCYVGHLQTAGKQVSATNAHLSKATKPAKVYHGFRAQQRLHIKIRDQCAEALMVYKSVTGPLKLKYAQRRFFRVMS